MADKKLLDEDGVSQFAEETKKYVDKHADNADIHVTATDKSNWNGKQDALTVEQLAAANSGINATAKGNYDAHVANADIHVTTSDKANWNGKQDALTSQQIDNINDVVNKANASDLTAHTNNSDIHVTSADKIAWNSKQNALSTSQLNACNSGITSTKVATYDGYASSISSKANASDLTAHTNNSDIHVTASDKSVWNGKQDALTSQQLANIADVVNKANDSDVVHKTGDETISGNKRFSGSTLYFNHANVDNVKIFANTEGGNIRLTDSDNNYHYEFDTVAKDYLRLFCGDSSDDLISAFCFYNNGDFLPAQGARQNFGSSAFKWKTINGINPGAFSLPNHNSYLDIKGNFPVSVSDDSWASRYQITPEQDGILILHFSNCSGAVVWNDINLPSYGESSTSIFIEKRVQAFVLKGVTYNIITSNYSQVVIARLFYCQGNV